MVRRSSRDIPHLHSPTSAFARQSRHTVNGLQVKSITTPSSLIAYKRSFHGSLPRIWAKIPQRFIEKGLSVGWLRIENLCKKFLTGKLNRKNMNMSFANKKRNISRCVYNTTVANEYTADMRRDLVFKG